MSKKNGDYTKKLISDCDDHMFMSSDIELTYNPKSPLACIELRLKLQGGGNFAILREYEIQQLINNLETFKERVKNHKDPGPLNY